MAKVNKKVFAGLDRRFGYITPEGEILHYPSVYYNGEDVYNARTAQTATRVNIGKTYFYIVRDGAKNFPSAEQQAELLAIVNKLVDPLATQVNEVKKQVKPTSPDTQAG